MYVMADTAPIIGASVRIPKDALDSHDIERIRRDLTFRVGGEGRYGFGAKAHTTMMYDDSGEWMTVPRAYGMRLLRDLRGVAGMDAIDVMSSGMPAEFTFDEELQSKRPFMKSIQDRLVGTTVRKLTGGIPGGILCAPCGCHAAGERVLMANGTSKKVEDVEVGDLLIGIDGPRRVLELHRGRQRMVRITPNKGESFVVNLGHILTVMWSVSDGARRDGELIDIPVSEWILSSKNFKRHTVLYRPEVESFDGNDVNVYDLINPYWLGLLLGDGSIKRSPAITTKDAEILTEIQHMAKWFGLIVRKDTHDGRCPTYYFTCGKRGGGAHHDQNVLVTKLKELGLWGTSARTKFVPDQYKYGSSAVRRQVLAGLIDTDGSLTRGCFEFSSASEQLADDVTFMSRSLGLAAHKTQKRVVGEIYWKVMISGHCSTIPTRIHRKKCPKRPINKDARRVGIKSTTLLPEDTYYGFVVNGDHRYLMADFTLTHNTGKTVMGCKVTSEIGTTTLILAHKEFLVDQWRDRISTWLKMPQDEIGIVQQNRCDYHGKRIVVAMLQSIVERDYDPELYSWPGLLIADECVSGDAVITTERGGVRIDEIQLRGAKYVLSFNETRGSFEWRRILRWLPRGSKQTRIVRFTEGSLRCTDDHLAMTDNGWTEARNLRPGMRILSPVRAAAERKSCVTTSGGEFDDLSRGIGREDSALIAQRDARSLNEMPRSANADVGNKSSFAPTLNENGCEHRGGQSISPDTTERGPDATHYRTRPLALSTERCLGTPMSENPIQRHRQESRSITRLSRRSGRGIKQRDCKDSQSAVESPITPVTALSGAEDKAFATRSFSTSSTSSDRQSAYQRSGLSASPMRDGRGGTATMEPSTVEEFASLPTGILVPKSYRLSPICADEGLSPKLGRQKEGGISDSALAQLSSGCDSSGSMSCEGLSTSYRTITSIEDGPEGGEDVFDLDVEGNHNFIANGVVIHNCHRHGADLWHKAAMRFTSKYRLGLTATPTRKDGMWDVVRNNFGEILAKDSGEAMQPTVYVVRYVPRFALSRYAWAQGNPIGYTRVKKIYLGKFITLLTEDPARNRMLVQILMKAFREGRKNLVLTDRREHIETLKKMITAEDKTATVGRYVGGMSPKARALSEQCQIILGTFQMASEALDIPALDAGILATPHADVEQAVGRICRLQDEKKQPVLVDIFDDEQYIGRPLFEKRERFFQSRGWPIRYIGG